MLQLGYGPIIDYKSCNGCGRCYDVCPMDVFGWNKTENKPEIVYPGDCRFDAFCEYECPQMSIDLRFPVHAMLDFGIDPRKIKK